MTKFKQHPQNTNFRPKVNMYLTSGNTYTHKGKYIWVLPE